MQKNSRSYNILRNSVVTIGCQIITIILGFLCRKSLIVTLGLPYAGASTIFTNIIGMLAFLELGIGHALTYSLYKPIADNNKEQIAACISFFTKLYHGVAIAIFFVGLCFVPFLTKIVNVDQGIQENVYLMYLLTLAYTCSTYFMAAPKTLLIADQKEYVVNIVYQLCHILQVAAQIIVLFVWKDYYLFLAMQVAFALINNIWTASLVHKKNPFLRQLKGAIDPAIKTDMIVNIKSSFLYRVGTSFLNNVNSLFVGYYCGLTLLGKISIYGLILSTMSNLLRKTSNSFTATVGNKGAAESIDSSRATFFKSHFLISWIGFFFLGGYLIFSSGLVKILFGSDCVIEYSLVLMTGILSFVGDVHSISGTYRFALGFFKRGRLAPLFAALLNIALSFAFYYMFGIVGIYLAPIVARVVIMGGVDSYLIVGGFKGIYKYFMVMAKYCFVFALIYLPCHYLFNLIKDVNLITLILLAFVYTGIFNGLWVLFFRKNENCKGVLLAIRNTLGRKRK